MPTEAELKAAREMVEKAQKEEADRAVADRLVAAGKAYYTRLLKHIGDRYTLLDMKAAGEQLVESLKEAPIDKLEAAEAEVEKMVDAKFPNPGHGKSTAEDGQQTPPPFDPLRYSVGGRL